jgi:hypothetical protein
MKKIMLSALLFTGSFVIAKPSEAQVSVGVNINIGDQPRWRVPGYDYVQYYYLPEIGTYYDVGRHQFVYLSNGRWVFSASLPYAYRNYDLYGGYKVVINQPHAYRYYETHRVKYGGNKYGHYKNKQNRGRGRH